MNYLTLIDVETLMQRIGEPGWVIFDCRFDLANLERGRRDYLSGHIPGAHFAHLELDLSGPVSATTGRHPLPDSEKLSAWLGQRGVAADSQVVVYDDSYGSMAVRLWWLLRWLGHGQVAVLDGGWQAWQESRGSETRGIPATYSGAPYPGRPNPQMLVTTEEILADLPTRRWLLVDARTAERYRGEQEPIDPVAGHVPGARNLPLQQNLDADGRFLAADRLRGLYLRLLGGAAAESVACFCGSGVSACHNLLAMEIAGLTGARLFAGSWSEWIRDPARPVATGSASGEKNPSSS